jgi:deoxyribodipyrimidine photo-lyase
MKQGSTCREGGWGEEGRRTVVVWMRRGLRVQDLTPLWTAVKEGASVVPVVCLRDDAPTRKQTLRREFMREALIDCDASLRSLGSRLFVRSGTPEAEIPAAVQAHRADAVYAVRVYDPAGIARDGRIAEAVNAIGAAFVTFKDTVLFEGNEIRSGSGAPYRVFTPYMNAWLGYRDEVPPVLPLLRNIPSPEVRGGDLALSRFPGMKGVRRGRGETMARHRLRAFLDDGLRRYGERRDFPGEEGTSRLSPYLAVGALSIRTVLKAVRKGRQRATGPARAGIDCYLKELLWREFYYQVLHNFPHVAGGAFREELNDVSWSRNRRHFAAWCQGRTGYPIVDAAMRQLQQEGWMHNRARMIVASFLTKDLHINWQWGERYFLDHLIDADIALNNGGWQWTAGTGTDASPWFRIFNPVLQGEKFDPDGLYVRRYVPELARVPARAVHRPWVLTGAEQRDAGCVLRKDYPGPIVNHNEERKVTLALYRNPGPRRHPR